MSVTFNNQYKFCAFSMKSSEFSQLRPIDLIRFTSEEIENDDGSTFKVFTYHSDHALLLNAERIVRQIGPDGYANIVNSLRPSASPYNVGENGKSVYSDEGLLASLKSRFTQRSSDIVAWFQSLVGAGENIRDQYTAIKKAEFDAAVKAEAAKAEAAKSSSEIKTE